MFGGGGMLATDLVRTAPIDIGVTALTRAEADVTDRDAVEAAVEGHDPDVVINASAYTAVDRAESERAVAFAVNGTAVGELARLCRRRDLRLVHFSTDYVFPGTASRPYREDDPVDPVNAYGESKLAGERAILEAGGSATIIRTQWLFGAAGKSFPRTMWERARARQPTRVVDDQFGRPSYTVDVARATWAIVRRGSAGIVHVANAGSPVTWHTLAKRIFESAEVSDFLSPCTSEEYPTPARRPRHSALATERLEGILGHGLPHWADAVDRLLRELAPATH